MEFVVAKSLDAYHKTALSCLRDVFMKAQKEERLAHLTLPTGNSPLSLYAEYLKDEQLREENFLFSALDEYAGLMQGDPRNFTSWIRQVFLNHAGGTKQNQLFFNPYADDTKAEADRFSEEFKKRGVLDCAVLGVGSNFHVGMNEPDCDPKLSVHVSKLADETHAASMKYWEKEYPNLPPLPYFGYTLGMADLLAAKQVLILLPNKKELADEIKELPPSAKHPVSLFKNHPNTLALIV